MKCLRVARKFLTHKAVDTSVGTIAHQRRAFESAHVLVRVYYGVTLYLLVEHLDLSFGWLALTGLSPLWPVAWVKLTGIPTAVHVIMTVFLIATLLSTLFPEKRVFRALFFVSMLEFAAFHYSVQGDIFHGWHGWLGIGFCFIFLPDGKRGQLQGSITKRQLYLTTFWAALALVLSFYSLSGFWKVIMGGYQLLKGETHSFAVDAMAHHIASDMIAHHMFTPNYANKIGSFIVKYPLVGWPMYLSVIYLQLFAFVAAFRPALHRFWGISLIGFHLMSSLTFSIGFTRNVLLLALFLVGSPFVDSKNSWRTVLYNLPLIGWGFKRTLSWRPCSSFSRSPASGI